MQASAIWLQNAFTALQGAAQTVNERTDKMAHELARMTDGRYAMAFIGETPWHGHGQALTADATIDQWTREAGFEWSAVTAPVTYTDGAGVIRQFEDKKILYRSDNGAPLSVVGDGFQIVQPADVMDFFRGETERAGWKLHTAGVMRDGRRLWAMASRDQTAEIVKGDSVAENLMLATGLDGTLATHAALTTIRIVCANTLAMALSDVSRNGRKAARISHRSNFDPEAIRAILGVADETTAANVQALQRLAAVKVEQGEARDLLRSLFGEPIPARGPAAKRAAEEAAAAAAAADVLRAVQASARKATASATPAPVRADLAHLVATGDAREQKSVARCLELFAGEGRGADISGARGTLWGLLNAITEHVDHEQGRDATRWEAATFGRGAEFKSQALELMTKRADEALA